MDMSASTLDELLEKLDSCTDPLAEHHVSNAVRKLRGDDTEADPPLEWRAEAMAFEFCEDYTWDDWPDGGWGTYFGPMTVFGNDDGTSTVAPSITLVTPEMLDYWKERAQDAAHPVLRARYAGLVWEFARTVTGTSARVEMAHIWIDSIVRIAETGCHEFETDVFAKLGNALGLAMSLRDMGRAGIVRDAVLDYEDRTAADGSLGLWGYSFDLLLCNKKVILSQEQRDKIVGDLELRLERVADPSGTASLDPWAAEAAATRLATYYREQGRPDDVKRVMLTYGRAFEKMAEPAVAMLAQAWLQGVYERYREHGLKEDADRLLRKIRELGPKVREGMACISGEFTVTNEQMEQYVQRFADADLATSLGLIAVYYIPRRDEVEKQIRETSTRSPIAFLMTRQLQDHKGRPVAAVGPLESDLDGHVILQIAQNIQLSSIFLRHVMVRVIEAFGPSADELVEYCCLSPLFEEDGKLILREGLAAYLAGNALVCMHLLIPQLEAAIRTLVASTGGTVWRRNQSGGFHAKTLGALLEDERVSVVFNEDVSLYFRILLTDPRGMNLRNSVCHGLSHTGTFNMDMADRVMHALLVLAQVRDNSGSAQS